MGRKKKPKMNITLAFQTRICTKETYPHSFEIKFARELNIAFDSYKDENELLDIIFKDAHDFENIITSKLQLVDSTTEILGVTFIHHAKNSELLDLARLGIKTL